MANSADKKSELYKVTELKEWIQLRDLYRNINWPEHCVGYYCLDNFIRWLEKEDSIDHLNCYSLKESISSEGLFAIVHRYQLFIGTLNRDKLQNLAKLLQLLDWSKGFKVSSFCICYHPAVVEVVRLKNLDMEYDSLTLMYFMKCEDACKLDISCPKGFCVKTLSARSTDANVINDHWPNRHTGSLILIRRLIELNISMGVYTEDTNELVAWCLRLQGGFLGALQVRDSYLRMGFGSLVTKAISRAIAQRGDDVMALVGEWNLPSRSMFEKLGFTVTDRCHWLRTYPTISGYCWPEDI